MRKNAFLLATIALLAAISISFADQCQSVTDQQAFNAMKYLRDGITIWHYCALCPEPDLKPIPIVLIETRKVGDSVEISVNREPIDLAYIYVPNGRGNYENLAFLSNCHAYDVPRYLNSPMQPALVPKP